MSRISNTDKLLFSCILRSKNKVAIQLIAAGNSVIYEGQLHLPNMQQQKFTPQQALPKIKQYCAYQERCHYEVKEKLYSFGLHKNDVEETISKLIEDNYLSEERFAIHFAGGKFRIKQWGRIKIKYELKQKQVSEFCIKKALAAIDDADYAKTLQKLMVIKLKSLEKEKNIFLKRKKIQEHLRMKGYETDLVNDLLKGLK